MFTEDPTDYGGFQPGLEFRMISRPAEFSVDDSTHRPDREQQTCLEQRRLVGETRVPTELSELPVQRVIRNTNTIVSGLETLQHSQPTARIAEAPTCPCGADSSITIVLLAKELYQLL